MTSITNLLAKYKCVDQLNVLNSLVEPNWFGTEGSESSHFFPDGHDH